jgi:hypothetical protein
MRGDFTRDTFNPAKHFLRVLMQQGRVELDADSNEQTAILLHYLTTLATDLIGPYGGPEVHTGFGLLPDLKLLDHLNQAERDQLKQKPVLDLVTALLKRLNTNAFDFLITPGRYYVDGILCENEDYVIYSTQASYLPVDKRDALKPPLLFYLDVWERSISAVEDDSIREVALGGPDTAARAKVEWQVRLWPTTEDERKQPPSDLTPDEIRKNWPAWVNALQPQGREQLRASVKSPDGAASTDPCITHPEARYRGAENQLYRVEIHQGGAVGVATFKWSRENNSLAFPIITLAGNRARLASLGRDTHLGLKVNDWVEIVDDGITLRNEANPLYQIAEIDPIDLIVTLKVPDGAKLPTYDETSKDHPHLRRWDQKGDAKANGAVFITEADKDKDWIALEDNIQIQFQKGGQYRTGDYWLIPARTATGDIEWPKDANGLALALPPHGIDHHYAPLAIWAPVPPVRALEGDAEEVKKPKRGAAAADADPIADCRLLFTPLAGK